MKNYYLKRIDELKTEVGSDRQGTPVRSAIMAIGSPLLPSAARGLTNLRSSFRKSMALARLKAKKNSPERLERLKDTEDAIKAARGVAAKNAAIKAARGVEDKNAAIKAAGEKPRFGAGLGIKTSKSRPSTGKKPGPIPPPKPKPDFSKFGAGVNPDVDPEGDEDRLAQELLRYRERNLQGKGPRRLRLRSDAKKTQIGDRSVRFRPQRKQQSYSAFGDSTTYLQIGYILAESMGLIK